MTKKTLGSKPGPPHRNQMWRPLVVCTQWVPCSCNVCCACTIITNKVHFIDIMVHDLLSHNDVINHLGVTVSDPVPVEIFHNHRLLSGMAWALYYTRGIRHYHYTAGHSHADNIVYWLLWQHHPLKCVQWPVLLGGALGRMFGGSSNFLLTFDSKSMYIGYVLTISWLN